MALTQHDIEDIDARELARVAMFPLPNGVLLPGALMPLHIFEPRYRAMMRDILDGSGLIALARLRPGYEADYFGRPAVHQTLGIGRVIDSYALDDGRYDVLVRGLIRATLVEELPAVHAYREVRASELVDRVPVEPGVLGAVHSQLINLCDELSTLIAQGGEELRALVRRASSPGTCADMVASVLIVDPDERQALLETRDPLARLERAITQVSRIIAEVEPDDGPSRLRN